MTRASAVRTGKLGLALLAAVLLSATCAWARPTTPEQAQTVVANWLGREALPMGAPLGRQIKEVQTFNDEAGNPSYYVVYLNPSGLVFLPADDLVEPIIGFLPSGIYDPSPINPLGALVSRDIPGRVLKVREQEAKGLEAGPTLTPQTTAARRKWEQLANPSTEALEQGLPSISDVRVAPFVQSRWSQGNVNGQACYNYFTPPNGPGSDANYVCGCVATAMAQLMRHWQHPTTGVGTKVFPIKINGQDSTRALRGGDGAGGPYAWNSMPYVPDASITGTQRQAIGSLTADAGVSVSMQYASDASGAYMEDVGKAIIDTFKYSNAKFGNNNGDNLPEAERNAMVNPNLQAGYPILFGITGSSGGHAIVCDGYGYNSSTMYHHLNMGWAGDADAWYNLPNIDVGFDSVRKCLYNVYVAGSGEIIAGRVTDESDAPISGATVTATSGGGTYNATTDAKGLYALAKVPSATTYSVSVSAAGYKFTSKTVATGTSTDATTTTGNLWGVDFAPGGGGGTPLSRALDNPDLQVTTGGNANWFVDNTHWHYGGSSARSGGIGVNQGTGLNVTLVGPGTLSFYWGVSSLVWYNHLSLYFDGMFLDRISGGVSWTEKTLFIPPGTHVVSWFYSKTTDNWNPYVPDCAWVDCVGYSNSTPNPKNSAINLLLLND